MNERLTIRNQHFEISTWLPIGRCDAGHGSSVGTVRMANRPGVLMTITGNTGSIRTTAGDGFISQQTRGLKEGASSSALAEKDLTFYVKRFH
jgi:hypothetical protein